MLKNPSQFFIGGEWATPSADTMFDLVSPSTEEVFLQIAEAQEPDVNRAVAAARVAFDKGPWPRMTHAERAVYLREVATRMKVRAAEFQKVWTSEIGIVGAQAAGMIGVAQDAWNYYAGLAETFPFIEEHRPLAGEAGFLTREAVGVVAAIIPWNGPLMLIAYKLAPALLAGCTVILKASPEAPGAAYLMAEIFEEVGLPAGVVNVLTADREVSELLVRHPQVDKVTFTGSGAAGKKIASICGSRIARCTLELGGKSAAVVLDDYDVAKAANTLAGTTALISGQVCAALTRVVVSRNRHDAFVESLSSAFQRIKVGDPFNPEFEMGPLAMRRQRDRVEGYIEKGKAEGARIATGGGRPAHLNRGFYVEPTVFGNVTNDMTIAREEIFGPVVSVIAADSEEQAIEIANDTEFGLNASVFTDDVDRAWHVARNLRSGTVGHNDLRIDFSIAFGGFKQSGIGREGGTEGLLPFLETKTIILDGRPSRLI